MLRGQNLLKQTKDYYLIDFANLMTEFVLL